MPVSHTLTNREQYNAAVVDSYTMTMPNGSGAVTDPTGLRNISSDKLTVDFVAATGEFFWEDKTQTQVGSLSVDLFGGRSAMWVYRTGKGWVPFIDDARTDDILIDLVPAGYGWGELRTSIPFDVPASPGTEVLPFDAAFPIGLLSPKGCTFAPAGNTFSIDVHGIWRMDISFNLQGHNSSNSGRVFDAFLYDVTTATPIGNGISVGIGRNQEDTFFSVSALTQVTPAQTGDTLEVRVGRGNAVTGGDLIFANIGLQFVSELGSLIVDEGDI